MPETRDSNGQVKRRQLRGETQTPAANRGRPSPLGWQGDQVTRITACIAHPQDFKVKIPILQVCIIGESVNHCRFFKTVYPFKSVIRSPRIYLKETIIIYIINSIIYNRKQSTNKREWLKCKSITKFYAVLLGNVF